MSGRVGSARKRGLSIEWLTFRSVSSTISSWSGSTSDLIGPGNDPVTGRPPPISRSLPNHSEPWQEPIRAGLRGEAPKKIQVGGRVGSARRRGLFVSWPEDRGTGSSTDLIGPGKRLRRNVPSAGISRSVRNHREPWREPIRAGLRGEAPRKIQVAGRVGSARKRGLFDGWPEDSSTGSATDPVGPGEGGTNDSARTLVGAVRGLQGAAAPDQ
jgi:hypothetical protein